MQKISLLLLNLSLAIVISVSGVMAQTPETYTVQRGDSLIKIAKKVGVTVQALVETNTVTYPCLATKPTCLQTGWVLTVPVETPSPVLTVTPSIAPTANKSDEYLDMRTAIANEVNRLRAENGLLTLSWNDAVAIAAEQRSQDMAIRNYFSHFDPVTGAIAAAQLLPSSAYSPACENIFGTWGRDAASVTPTAIERWWNSLGHKRCMLLPKVTVIGVGIAQDSKGGWLVTLINARPK